MITGRLLAFVSLGIVALLSIVHISIYYSSLPDPVGSHFDGAGEVDGTMSKLSYSVLYVSLQIGLPLFWIVIGRLLHVFPDSMINLPHKDYWLVDNRRKSTLQYVETSLLWLGLLTSLFMMTIFHLTFLINLEQIEATSFTIIFPTLIYCSLTMVFVVMMLVKFNRVPKNKESSTS